MRSSNKLTYRKSTYEKSGFGFPRTHSFYAQHTGVLHNLRKGLKHSQTITLELSIGEARVMNLGNSNSTLGFAQGKGSMHLGFAFMLYVHTQSLQSLNKAYMYSFLPLLTVTA